jgi:long-chain acyl-CoA synthetase
VPSVEVETVYSEHPGIRDCAAVGVEDERWGEAILLVAVKIDPAANDADLAADIFQYGRDRLAGFKRPKKIAFTESLPRSHFGKVLKRDLREQPFREIFES